eukprot:Rhum_TRINITY_DN10304_c0_g1::Rhum_TRINITY_DN10304_c0_g1_i1::g.37797::m.37797
MNPPVCNHGKASANTFLCRQPSSLIAATRFRRPAFSSSLSLVHRDCRKPSSSSPASPDSACSSAADGVRYAATHRSADADKHGSRSGAVKERDQPPPSSCSKRYCDSLCTQYTWRRLAGLTADEARGDRVIHSSLACSSPSSSSVPRYLRSPRYMPVHGDPAPKHVPASAHSCGTQTQASTARRMSSGKSSVSSISTIAENTASPHACSCSYPCSSRITICSGASPNRSRHASALKNADIDAAAAAAAVSATVPAAAVARRAASAAVSARFLRRTTASRKADRLSAAPPSADASTAAARSTASRQSSSVRYVASSAL